MLSLSACKTTQKAETTTMSLNEFEAMAFDVDDTLYIPWQWWAGDSQPPLPIVRKIHGKKQTERVKKDTTKTESVQQNSIGRATAESKSTFRKIDFILIGLLLGIWFVAVARRRS